MNKAMVAKEIVEIAKVLTGKTKVAVEELEVIVRHLSMDVTEDSWEEGEIGRGETILDRPNFGVFKSVKDAVKKASSETGIPEEDFYVFEGEGGRIEGEGMVDENNSYVGDDKRFIERWKKGEVKAWSARVSMRVKLAKTWVPDSSELAKISGLKEN